MDVLSHQRGLFTHSLAGGDLGCGTICYLSCMIVMLGLPVMARAPAPQLKTVMHPYRKISDLETFQMTLRTKGFDAESWDIFVTWTSTNYGLYHRSDWAVFDKLVIIYEELFRAKKEELKSLLSRWDIRLEDLGKDPTYLDWSRFRPLRLSREEDWSDWLAFLIEASVAGTLSRYLFGEQVGISDFALPKRARREEMHKGYRADIIIEWREGQFSHIEVKVGDPDLAKTYSTGEALQEKFQVPPSGWGNYILLLDGQLPLWEGMISPENHLAEILTITWTDVCISIRRSLLSEETLLWKAWAYAYLGAIEQLLIGFPGNKLWEEIPNRGLNEKIHILKKGLEDAI